ncbi:hypothetical protein CAter282_2330 [Collimonas arenae]|uniref:Uncharacterized protein n=1 Tax=Collimonas arenae TaxID=279058 RepID=A0A127PR07_9BURK|nr:hypothetical protein [Collimonas arenae]AMP00206.1 hypothetical protein CAter10_2562 [Collimonas arenae]AMP10078.1 hypothetical protein CAter282_2330 [Collimonas arenae]
MNQISPMDEKFDKFSLGEIHGHNFEQPRYRAIALNFEPEAIALRKIAGA